MGRSFLTWWEALPPRKQILASAPVLTVVIFAVHEAFFPLLEWTQSAMYAAMEGVPAALLVTFATQTELSRRADATSRQQGAPSDLPPGGPGSSTPTQAPSSQPDER